MCARDGDAGVCVAHESGDGAVDGVGLGDAGLTRGGRFGGAAAACAEPRVNEPCGKPGEQEPFEDPGPGAGLARWDLEHKRCRGEDRVVTGDERDGYRARDRSPVEAELAGSS